MTPDEIVDALRKDPDFDCPCTCGNALNDPVSCPFCDATAANREERTVAADLIDHLIYKGPDQTREDFAAWMLANGYATGHGDTLDDLISEFKAQHQERLEIPLKSARWKVLAADLAAYEEEQNPDTWHALVDHAPDELKALLFLNSFSFGAYCQQIAKVKELRETLSRFLLENGDGRRLSGEMRSFLMNMRRDASDEKNPDLLYYVEVFESFANSLDAREQIAASVLGVRS